MNVIRVSREELLSQYRKRSVRRTDFGRPRARGSWFSRGRSLPTVAITVGAPHIYRYLIGQYVGTGHVNAIDIPKGTFWVTP